MSMDHIHTCTIPHVLVTGCHVYYVFHRYNTSIKVVKPLGTSCISNYTTGYIMECICVLCH